MYVRTRNPMDKNAFVDGELVEVQSKEETPNIYKLADGSIIYAYLDLDSVNLPIDPKSGEYFKNNTGEKIYNLDYHVRIVIARPSSK